MIAILFLIAVIFVLALMFAWLAENPGSVTLEWPVLENAYTVPVVAAVVGLIALIAAVMLAWWVLKGITRAPAAIVDHQRGRQRDKGYAALSEGMLALGAGDVSRARALAKQADRRLGHTREPMVLLLEAQTALAEEKHDEARTLFDEMLDEPQTRPLGLRGLFLEAQREGEHEAARHYAERAATLSPQHLWATEATLEYATLDGDYERALGIVDDQERVKSVDKAAAQRKRAVLWTALAMREVEADPTAARDHGRRAHRAEPTLVPAAVVESRAHVRLDELRKGARVLEETWRVEPHPGIATAYVHLRPGDSTADRLKRAEALAKIKPGHIESHLAVAHAALDAHDYDRAREKAEAAVRVEPREGAFLLLADVEEATTGDATRVRHWLQCALRAPRDPAWVADGYVSEEWAPVSPVTGKFDAFEWKRPARQLDGPAIEAGEALDALPAPGSDGIGSMDGTGPTGRGADYEGGPRGDGLRGPDVSDAEFVEVKPDAARQRATASADGRMVAMDGSGEGTGTRGDTVTVVSGSGERAVAPGGDARDRAEAGARAPEARRAGASVDLEGSRPAAANDTAGAPPPPRPAPGPQGTTGEAVSGATEKRFRLV